MTLSLEQENRMLGAALALCLRELGNTVRVDLRTDDGTGSEFIFDYEREGRFITAVTITRVTQGSKLVN